MAIDPRIRAEIDARLDGIVAAEGVRVPLAVESGSRAWGFPSPDSDYDCRFIYVRPLDSYLSLTPPRDVIETPLTAVLDVGGWDFGKALKLMLKGNAVVLEWLTSPVVYRLDPVFRQKLIALAREVVDPAAVARHYFHLALGQKKLAEPDADGVKLKKLFYVLRPLVALRWLTERPGEAVAPMHLPTLMEETDMRPELRRAVADLIERKRAVRELGRGPVPSVIMDFIEAGLGSPPGAGREPRIDAARAAAMTDSLFRDIVKGGLPTT